jgi:hypothetical protein
MLQRWNTLERFWNSTHATPESIPVGRVRSSSRAEKVISGITQHTHNTQLRITFSQNRNPNRNNHIFFDTIEQ